MHIPAFALQIGFATAAIAHPLYPYISLNTPDLNLRLR
jgi:hypothetical protein